MKSNDEILACIKKEDIKYLQAGQLSNYIFPMNRSEAHKKTIKIINYRQIYINEYRSLKIFNESKCIYFSELMYQKDIIY